MIFESFTNSWYFSYIYNFNNKKLSSENNEHGYLSAFTNIFSSSLKLLFLINPPLKNVLLQNW